MSYDMVRKTIADAIRKNGFSTVIGKRVYTAEELAEEVEKETEVGRKVIEMALRGTIERYAKISKGKEIIS